MSNASHMTGHSQWIMEAGYQKRREGGREGERWREREREIERKL